MNRYIDKKSKKWWSKKSKFNTGPIDPEDQIENEVVKMEDFKNSEPTHKESLEYGKVKTINAIGEKNKDTVFHNNIEKSAQKNTNINMNRSIFSESKPILETKKEENNSEIAKWDKLKLLKLQEKLIDSSYTSDSFITFLDNNYNIMDFTTIFNNVSNFPEIIKSLITSSTPIVIKSTDNDNSNNCIKKLFGLMRTSKADFGSSNLKIGWPYVTGYIPLRNKIKTEESTTKISTENINNPYSNSVNGNPKNSGERKSKEGQFFYAPLILWPTIIQTKDHKNFTINLSRQLGQLTVEVNSHLLLSLTYSNNFFENPKNMEIKTDSFVHVLYSNDLNVFVNNIVEKYSFYGYKFSADEKTKLFKILQSFHIQKFVSIPRIDEIGYAIERVFGTLNENELRVLPFGTIGTYPIANVSLFIDYVKMIKSDGVGFVNKIDNTFYSQLQLAEEYHKYFSEAQLKEIVKLDFSQKKACNVALNDNLVISGAAGNGKSQTISSIIANAINNLKSVLFSTEKKEAANVIFNRLGRLRNYSLKLFESDNFAKDFTSQLKNGLERISLVYGIQDNIKSTNTSIVSEKLDVMYKRVNDFKSIMMTEDGQNYPEYIFKKNKYRQELKDVIHLVGPILKNSESSSDFWLLINKINDDYNEFNQLAKMKEALQIQDDLFTQAFNLIKYFDGNNLFYDNYLVQYAKNKTINEQIEELPEEELAEFFENKDAVNLELYSSDSKSLYWSLYNLFQRLDDYSIDIMKMHDVNWYTKTSSLVKQKSTELIIEFREKYSPDEFDYEFYKDYYEMEKFAADYGDNFQIDNENYYNTIDNLITNKLGEDIRTTEFLFALKITKILKENKEFAESFNKLYALVKNSDVLNSVDDVLINYSNIISLIFPLILGSPNMISKYVVCQSNVFDVCIIDEASMIPLENAFPLLYRSSRWIVSGDLKQLPPVTYQKNIEAYNKYRLMQLTNSTKNIQSEHLMKYKAFETPISLLEYIGTKIQTVVLEYHYRSVKKELFEFSNVVFYKNMIHVADDQNKTDENIVTGINLKTTNGICTNGINEKEAQEVVKIVEQIVEQPNHGTIGIITTTNEQRDYIEDLLLAHPSKLVTNEFSRISEDGEDNSMFVLTCEKVQGSERDNIIISFVASKDKDNAANFLSVNKTLGVLGTEVGPNFLNVLITRSRLALFIVNSFGNEEIIVDNNPSLAILKDYLDYAKLLTSNGHNLNDPRVQAIFKPYIKNNAVLDFSNDMKGRAVSRIAPDLKDDLLQIFAFEPRLEIVDGWYEGSVKIDLVIRDRKTKRNIMGILCDEFIYDVMINGKQRDYYNRKFLESRNWKFYSLSSLQWAKIYKRKSIIDQIINILTMNLTNWTQALRITKLAKYAYDENGNVVIVDDLIKKANNHLDVIEIDEPLYYEGDEELTNSKSKTSLSDSNLNKINPNKNRKSNIKNIRKKINKGKDLKSSKKNSKTNGKVSSKKSTKSAKSKKSIGSIKNQVLSSIRNRIGKSNTKFNKRKGK